MVLLAEGVGKLLRSASAVSSVPSVWSTTTDGIIEVSPFVSKAGGMASGELINELFSFSKYAFSGTGAKSLVETVVSFPLDK